MNIEKEDAINMIRDYFTLVEAIGPKDIGIIGIPTERVKEIEKLYNKYSKEYWKNFNLDPHNNILLIKGETE